MMRLGGLYVAVYETCRKLEFRPDHTFEGKRLKGHVIKTVDAMDTDFCELQCYLEPSCLSFNFMKSAKKCQLNNSTFERQKNKLEKNLDFIYSGAKV
ncbi:unnamed protein product, partial [Porites lobata]